MPFACKLEGKLAARLQELAREHPAGMNGLVAEVLEKGLAGMTAWWGGPSPAEEGEGR